jgi:tRNA(Ile)-lysidine synthase
MDAVEGVIRGLGRMTRPGESLGLAVSGGADSTALMQIAALASEGLGIRLHVLHVDHGLRAESNRDAMWVADAARELGLDCELLRVEVTKLPRQSLEALARDARYSALEKAAADLGLHRVATAHTLDDQAETVLLRILRGTGVGGLAGIEPQRGIFIRPMLGVRRDDLRWWLDEQNFRWIEDASNEDLSIDRNWIRHEILPQLAARRQGVALNLVRLSELAREDVLVLDSLARERFRSAVLQQESVELPDSITSGPPALANRVVLLALHHLGARADAMTVARVLEVAREKLSSADIGGARVRRSQDGIEISSESD